MQKSKPRSRRHAHWLLPFASPGHGNEFSGRSSGCQDTQASLSALWLALQLGASSAVTSVEWLEVRRRTTRRAGHGIWFPSSLALGQNLRSGARENERLRFGTATSGGVPGPDGELPEPVLASQGLSRRQ